MSTAFNTYVAEAIRQRDRHAMNRPSLELAALRNGYTAYADINNRYRPWINAIERVNQHITVPDAEIQGADQDYREISEALCRQLDWHADEVEVFPQGSSATRTLIRKPRNNNYDIDAICAVDSDRVDVTDPIGFFDQIGDALRSTVESLERKNRCWHVRIRGRDYYLEFTPSIPLKTVGLETYARMDPAYRVNQIYASTALAVADNKLQGWKNSNPAGLAQWINKSSEVVVCFTQAALESYEVALRAAKIESVPSQEVSLTDTLRMAIRLCKRHRDMCIHRDRIQKENEPISIIIATLLTMIYNGLAVSGRVFEHPLDLLIEMIELLPYLVDAMKLAKGEYYVPNPTVDDENFAEKWNDPGSRRATTFNTWCTLLKNDLYEALDMSSASSEKIEQKVLWLFGCSATSEGPGEGSSGPGETPISAGRDRVVRTVPATGLA